MAQVTLNKVVKKYDETLAVRGIDLDIFDKEFVVLVGPSGCGKSTTLRMIAGLEEITDGEILIGGDVVNDLPPKDRDIAMVFQNYALYPHMTVFENMSFGLRLKKFPKPEIRERVQAAAHILDITDLLDRRPPTPPPYPPSPPPPKSGCPAGSASASKGAAPSFAPRKSFCSTSHSRT